LRRTIQQAAERIERSVPVGTLALVQDALQEIGVDGGRLLQSMGIEPNFLAQPLTPIPVEVVGKIVAEAVRQSACPHFAAVIGSRARLDNAGLLPILLASEARVRDAIADLIRFLRIWYQGIDFDFHADHGSARLTVSVSNSFEGHIELCTKYTAAMLRHLETCIGRDWRPSRVGLARRRPRAVLPYQPIFRTAVEFDQFENVIEFPASLLDRRRDVTHAGLRTYLRDQLLQLESTKTSSATEHVNRLIKVLLMQEACTVEQVGKLMFVHRKTLHRLLRKEGTTFEAELEGIRRQLAVQMLSGTVAPIGEIARALGYTSPANFSRAFLRWFGMSPTQWRQDAAS
jgi:AraC-like DNA-binding protein